PAPVISAAKAGVARTAPARIAGARMRNARMQSPYCRGMDPDGLYGGGVTVSLRPRELRRMLALETLLRLDHVRRMGLAPLLDVVEHLHERMPERREAVFHTRRHLGVDPA